MTLNLQTPFPTFGGSTGGWLRAAEVEEKYAITWTSKKEQIFEMPTGGAAIMRTGENLLYLARKEQCLALGTQLRTFKLNDYKELANKINNYFANKKKCKKKILLGYKNLHRFNHKKNCQKYYEILNNFF